MEPMYSETEEVKQRVDKTRMPRKPMRGGSIKTTNGEGGKERDTWVSRVQGSGPLYRRENRKDTQASNATSIDNALLTAFLVLLMRQL